MSEQKTPKISTALFSALPILFLLFIDIYTMFLQPLGKAVTHLGTAMLAAQLICLLIYGKGEICNGQRSRLNNVNCYFALYWGVWLLLDVFSTYHYVLTSISCVCGLLMVMCVSKHFAEDKVLLNIAALIGVIGLLAYLVILFYIPSLGWLQYNIIAQLLTGVIIANIALVISRNRLQGFIALLPLVMAVLLLLNVLAVLGILALNRESAVLFSNEFALVLYFVLHLVMMGMLAWHIFRKTALSYNTLMIMLLMSATLPLWATFAYIG
ncbi:hypothetical protein RYD26_04715 [Pasteurellaceae bacterium LIM206]|nr:hypothetical protein [Pasteurellaceae bacterium LIM206]